MDKEELQLLAFKIIGNSGEALNCFYSAIVFYKQNNQEEGLKKLEQGKEILNTVHNLQTKLIQAEANNEELPYSLIMTHAQDHLNSAINWERMASLLLKN